MGWLWLSLTIGFLVAELATTRLFTIWFSVGAGITAIFTVTISDLQLPIQLLIFISASLLLLFILRPLICRKINKTKKSTKKE